MGRKALEVGPISSHVANTLAGRREDIGISLRDLGEKAGINYMRIRRVLAAERVMTVDELESLADALGLVGWKIMREAEEAVMGDLLGPDGFRLAALDPGYSPEAEADQ